MLALLVLMFLAVTGQAAFNSSASNATLFPVANANFSCLQQDCANFGQCVNGQCACAAGFGLSDCSALTCGSVLVENAARSPKPIDGDCKCDAGFSGINCNSNLVLTLVCDSDKVCGSDRVCNSSPKVWRNHHMFCSVKEPLLESIYPDTSKITIERNYANATSFGAFYYRDKEQFSCRMTSCQQSLDKTSHLWDCDSIECRCFSGSAFCGGEGVVIDIGNAIKGVSGSFSMKCPRTGTSACEFRISALDKLFPKGLSLLDCKYGECALPSQEPADFVQTSEMTGSDIAGMAVALSLVLATILFFVFSKFQQLKRKKLPIPPPKTGVFLKFQDVSYIVKDRPILKGLSGVAQQGKLMAIMGPSGAGKSTFLDILAQKTKSGLVEGQITVNGQQISSAKARSIIGYVDQEDLLLATLTVRETIMFSAETRLPECVPYDQKVLLVESVMQQLGLAHVADSRIGGNGVRGISGGEKRRVSIAVELVTSPSVLFLDEPTSGLDSYNAHLLINSLVSLAHDFGKTIIFTIHQPRSDVFQMFDSVYILSKGECMVHGSVDETIDFCNRIQRPCPVGYNIADHLLDLAVEISLEASLAATSIVELISGFLGSKTHSRTHSFGLMAHAFKSCTPTESVVASPQSSSPKEHSLKEILVAEPVAEPVVDYSVSFYTQFMQLVKRSFKVLVRKPSLLIAHMIIAVLLGAFVGGLYFRSDQSLGGVQNRLGSLFFILALIGFSSISAIGAFTEERLLFMRERSNGFYGPMPFFLTKILFDLVPLRLIPAAILSSIAYWMILYSEQVASFIKFFSMIMVFSAEMGLFCLAIGAAFRDVGTANLVASIVILFKMLLAGLLINQNMIPAALKWVQYLSLFKYAYEALAVNDISTIQIVDNVQGVAVKLPAAVVLDKFGFDLNGYYRNLLVSISCVCGLFAAIALLFIFRLKEKR